jgi:hypothetical protein
MNNIYLIPEKTPLSPADGICYLGRHILEYVCYLQVRLWEINIRLSIVTYTRGCTKKLEPDM